MLPGNKSRRDLAHVDGPSKFGGLDEKMDVTEPAETLAERTAADYKGGTHLCFDPCKDLNLPSSYEEVKARYKRLRSEPGTPSMN